HRPAQDAHSGGGTGTPKGNAEVALPERLAHQDQPKRRRRTLHRPAPLRNKLGTDIIVAGLVRLAHARLDPARIDRPRASASPSDGRLPTDLVPPSISVSSLILLRPKFYDCPVA